MNRSILICLGLLVFSINQPVLARDVHLDVFPTILPGESFGDRPSSLTPSVANRSALDTLSFGDVDEDGFAIEGETWTFDHGGSDPFEGWVTEDPTAQSRTFFRHITADIWTNGDFDNGNVPTENSVAAPILAGLGSAWPGAFQSEANDLCWDSGLGYGNSWCQELLGPVLDYDGSSSIAVGFEYFNDTEPGFDYSLAVMQTLPSGTETELARFDGQIGLSPSHPGLPPIGASHTDEFSDFQGDTQFRLIFRMTADGGWSDEDGQYATEYGPFAVDNVSLGSTGSAGDVDLVYDFESDLNGWTPTACPGFGSFEGIADVSNYVIEDPCGCELAGNVLEFHDENNEHPYGQRILSQSPPVDVANDVTGMIGGSGLLEIFADWSQYSVQPRANGVFYRPGWNYYPAICETTGGTDWSGRAGQSLFFSTGDDATCFKSRNVATGNGVPSDIEQIRFIYEIYASCDAFGIGEDECTETTNFTPIIDNVAIRFTLVPQAPRLSQYPTDIFTDGFGQSLFLDPNVPGNADVTRELNSGSGELLVNGDSMFVSGPFPATGFEYDTRLWFRVARKGPGSNSAGYDSWRARVQLDGGLAAIDGVTDIEAGEFATAKMDSFDLGSDPWPGWFVSYFVEEDARFDAGAGDLRDENEIIADGVLLPGTKIEYFITANYVNTPDVFSFRPDTSGGFFSEFEILPGWRDDGGVWKFPCLLYINADGWRGRQFVPDAIDALGLDHDRYDYVHPGWDVAPLVRGLDPRSNNGCTLQQLLGYRGILVGVGAGTYSILPRDLGLLSDWLTAITCDGNAQTRGLILAGRDSASLLNRGAPTMLSGSFGATLLASRYREYGPNPDEGKCVGIEAPSVGTFAYGTVNSQADYEYDAWNNPCPQFKWFDVIGATGSGVPNRAYVNASTGEETFYNQVVNDVGSGGGNYRTVISGTGWPDLADHEATGDCVPDSSHIATAVRNEIAAALEWVFGVGTIPGLCVNPCDGDVSEVPGASGEQSAAVTRLFQNSPNPFNPYTTLRFSLASSGPVELAIFDVSGRKVRTLVDGVLDAGVHEVVWDGTNEAEGAMSAGVYWSQFEALGMKSNKKMVLLQR